MAKTGYKLEAAEKAVRRHGSSLGKNTNRKAITEDDIRILAYSIWEKDRSKAADVCWFEAESLLNEG